MSKISVSSENNMAPELKYELEISIISIYIDTC